MKDTTKRKEIIEANPWIEFIEYYKYAFTFEFDYFEERHRIKVGGDHDDIYRFSVNRDMRLQKLHDEWDLLNLGEFDEWELLT